MRRKNLLATAMLSMALTLGIGGKEGGIKKHKDITRSWKEDQDGNDKFSRLEKAKQKRIRKAETKRVNLIKSRRGNGK